jgi:hypothetical protein
MKTPLSDLDEFRQRLGEVIAWCNYHVSMDDPQGSLRTSELQPQRWKKYGDPGFAGFSSEYTLAERVAIIDALSTNRYRLLRKDGGCVPGPAQSLAGGRLLLYVPDETLADCGAAEQTRGFFDCDDAPPWDTWLWFIGVEDRLSNPDQQWYSLTCLVSWVPPDFIQLVDGGISVCLGDSLRWAKDVDSVFTHQLRASNLA